MLEGMMDGLESKYKDLRLDPKKLLMSDDLRVVLANVGYMKFLEIFKSFDMNMTHYMISS